MEKQSQRHFPKTGGFRFPRSGALSVAIAVGKGHAGEGGECLL